MPFLTINTNVPSAMVDDQKLEAMSTKLAEITGSPIQVTFITVNAGLKQIHNGDAKAPAAYCTISAPDQTPEKNKKIVEPLYAMIKENLGVPNNKCYINFHLWDKKTIGAKGGMAFPDA